MKYTPIRTCILTREKLPQNELVRIVKVKNEDDSFSIRIQKGKKINGRGFYVKPDFEKFENALRKGAIAGIMKLGKKLEENEISSILIDFKKKIS